MTRAISTKKFTFSQEYREGVNDALDEIIIVQKELLSDSHFEKAVKKIYDDMVSTIQCLLEDEGTEVEDCIRWDIVAEVVCRAYKKGVDKINILKTVQRQLNEQLIDKKLRTSIDPGTRLKALKRDCYKCVYCGESPASSPKVTLVVDHIQPLAKGGENSLANYQTLCHYCHAGKGITF